MNNYYEFTNLIDDKESFEYFNSLSNSILKNILNDSFNDIDSYLNYYADTFKIILNGLDYDEFYYSFKLLAEYLNDIKIILNILLERWCDYE